MQQEQKVHSTPFGWEKKSDVILGWNHVINSGGDFLRREIFPSSVNLVFKLPIRSWDLRSVRSRSIPKRNQTKPRIQNINFEMNVKW